MDPRLECPRGEPLNAGKVLFKSLKTSLELFYPLGDPFGDLNRLYLCSLVSVIYVIFWMLGRPPGL